MTDKISIDDAISAVNKNSQLLFTNIECAGETQGIIRELIDTVRKFAEASVLLSNRISKSNEIARETYECISEIADALEHIDHMRGRRLQ